MTPTIDIDLRETITTDMQRTVAGMEGPQLREAIGLAGVEEVREYYTRLDHERANALGGKRTHFYAQAAESATWKDTGDGVQLDVTEPIGLALAIHGGTVLPGKNISSKTGLPTRYLTIPARAEAYGHRAGEFKDLVPVFRRIGGQVKAIALAQAEQQPVSFKKPRKDGTVSRGAVKGGLFFFWLVESITRQADPTAAPDTGRIGDRAVAAARDFFATLQGGFSGV